MMSRRMTFVGGLVVLALFGGWGTTSVRAQSFDEADPVLFLITERLVSTEGETEQTSFWWSNPAEPAWTGTDRQLMDALETHRIAFLRPGDETRISRIYQRPQLSTNNAAALGSVLGARRIVLGDVTYQRTSPLAPTGLRGVVAEASLKLIDVTASSPEVLRTYRFERSIYVEASRGDGGESLERARRRLMPPVAELLAQTLSIVSGEVGIEDNELLLKFHGLERMAALKAIRRTVEALDPIEQTAVRWAAEGVIALELNPDRSADTQLVRRAADALRTHNFSPLRLKPRSADERDGEGAAFEVRITGTFPSTSEETRRESSPQGEPP